MPATPFIQAASESERASLLERAAGLLERRHALVPSEPGRMIDWPRAPLAVRVLVGGIDVPSWEDGCPDAEWLDGFLEDHAGRVGVWSLGGEREGVHVGGAPFAELRNWMKENIALSPYVLLSLEADIVLVSDEQLRYSVLGAPPLLIEKLDRRFGGRAAFRGQLRAYIDQGEIGFGEEDRDWALNVLLERAFREGE